MNTRCFESELTGLDANWHKWLTGQGHETVSYGVRRSKVKVTQGQRQMWKPSRGVILDPIGATGFSDSSLFGLVLGWRPLGAVLHSSNEPGELLQWLCIGIIIIYYSYYLALSEEWKAITLNYVKHLYLCHVLQTPLGQHQRQRWLHEGGTCLPARYTYRPFSRAR